MLFSGISHFIPPVLNSTDGYPRCAFHFGSPRTQNDNRSLYQMLLSAQVFKTDEIITQLELTQNGTKIQATTLDKSTLCIKEDQSKLNIYVPKSPRDRELCYRRQLPSRLLAELMKDSDEKNAIPLDLRAVGIVADIMNCSDLIIEDILKDAGVVGVPFIDEFIPEIAALTPSSKPRESPTMGVLPDRSRTQLRSPAPENRSIPFIFRSSPSTPSPSPHPMHRSNCS